MANPKLAVVTGASRGLGLGVCGRLGRAGFRVVAACRKPDDAAKVAHELAGEGIQVVPETLDVAAPDDPPALAGRLRERGERIDVLVNNAGMSMKGFDAHVADATTDVNYRGAVRVTEALLPLILDGGRIVMVSSGMGSLSAYSREIRERFLASGLDRQTLDSLVHEFVEDVRAGRHSERGWPTSAYRVSKAAMNAYVRILAPELAPRRILVNAVCPGWVKTDMGGPTATRSLETGVESIAWAALVSDDGPTGGFFRDGARIDW